jgi:hypothetical protein
VRLSKFDELCAYISCLSRKPQFILGTETWLSDERSSEFYIPLYGEPIRSDRVSANRGGGVAIWIRSDTACTRVDVTEASPLNTDAIWIISHKLKCIICCLYITGSLMAAAAYVDISVYLSNCIDALHLLYLEYGVYIAGDFNTFFINNHLKDIKLKHDLVDMVTVPT